MSTLSDPLDGPTLKGSFPTTHWSVVLRARDETDARAKDALETLCQTYWYPLYAFLRRSGRGHEDAQDLIQGFFEQVIERRFFVKAERQEGRFRSFLIQSLKFYAATESRRQHAAKRGGGQEHLPLETEAGEQRYGRETADGRDPEKLFERRWALSILEQSLLSLEAEYATPERKRLFQEIQTFLAGEKGIATYAETAVKLNTSEAAVKMAVVRMRQRYRQTIREVIAHTVANPAEIEAELKYIIQVLSS